MNDHLVYVTGMPDYLADKNLLIKHNYFGQYGEIQHLTLQQHKGHNYTGFILYNMYFILIIDILCI